MSVTEKEAAEKWCPHVRYTNESETLRSNRGHISGFNGCMGTLCMAWRWAVTPEEAIGNRNGPRGYCGLAGKL